MAPPFVIVDPTVQLQNLPSDPISAFIPKIVAVEDAAIAQPQLTDVVGASVILEAAMVEGRADPQLHYRLEAGLREFGKVFPTREVGIGDLSLRYVPLGVKMSDVPLEEINAADGATGPSGAEVWEEHVVPAFGDFLI